MAGREPKDRTDSAAPAGTGMSAKDAAGENTSVVRRAFNQVLLGGAGRIMTFVALFFICAAGVFLVNAWHFGPNLLVEAAQYRKLTSQLDAPIVESWLAVDVDVAEIKVPEYWRASAKASPCAVVEYGGEWGAPIRRAFCGNRLGFSESYRLQDLHSMAPDVAFAWARDRHGFVVPEIRLSADALKWLETHLPDTFMHRRWPAKTALDWLRLEADRPVEAAVVGWTAKPAVMPISFDPQHPGDALPTGIVHTREQQQVAWIAVVAFAVLGLPLWFVGMELLPLVGGLTPLGRRIFAVALLCTLPWWADYFPRMITKFSTSIGSIVADMFSDTDKLDRLVASDPSDATLVNGSRLTWRFDDSVFADTLGQFKFVQPTPAPGSEDAARSARGDGRVPDPRATRC